MMLKNTNHGFYIALRNNDVAEVLRWLQNPNLRLTKFIGPIFEAAAASQHAEGGVAVYDHIVDKQYHLSKQEIEGIFASAHQANNGALFYALFEDLRLHIDSTTIGKYFESALKKGNGEIVHSQSCVQQYFYGPDGKSLARRTKCGRGSSLHENGGAKLRPVFHQPFFDAGVGSAAQTTIRHVGHSCGG